jgi:hypothetical protein
MARILCVILTSCNYYSSWEFKNMSQIVIGVDIAKKKFDVASLSDGKYKHKTFTNDEPGYAAFVSWLGVLFTMISRRFVWRLRVPIASL